MFIIFLFVTQVAKVLTFVYAVLMVFVLIGTVEGTVHNVSGFHRPARTNDIEASKANSKYSISLCRYPRYDSVDWLLYFRSTCSHMHPHYDSVDWLLCFRSTGSHMHPHYDSVDWLLYFRSTGSYMYPHYDSVNWLLYFPLWPYQVSNKLIGWALLELYTCPWKVYKRDIKNYKYVAEIGL